MHGPSSSHTAAAFRLGLTARRLLGQEPKEAVITFDRQGSYGRVFKQQGSDLSFACGLMDWQMDDPRFFDAFDQASASGLYLSFGLGSIPESNHPNAVRMELVGLDGSRLELVGRSTGGGAFDFIRLNDRPVHINGEAHDMVVLIKGISADSALTLVGPEDQLVGRVKQYVSADATLLQVHRRTGLSAAQTARLQSLPDFMGLWSAPPVFFMQKGQALFDCGAKLSRVCMEQDLSLGQAGLEYESALLDMGELEVMAEMGHRWQVMKESVRQGLEEELPRPLQTLKPCASKMWQAEKQNRLAIGGLHARTAARALAVMHQNGAMGLVCAAPTGGSCGTLPAVMVSLQEELGLSDQQIIMSLLAAGVIGLIMLMDGETFAAEVAGCQVEIGAAGAMAAAATVEAAGGSAKQAMDAAAISLQNTIGMPCDLVHGAVEIPCHTRNAVAASSALVCADMILGGYDNPIPLDQTVQASLKVGKALPNKLRCTSLGGIAVTPAAKGLVAD
jgi:L-serine dehydratase